MMEDLYCWDCHLGNERQKMKNEKEKTLDYVHEIENKKYFSSHLKFYYC